MLTLNQLIPDITSIRKILKRTPAQKPTAESLEAMCQLLTDYGYSDTNTEVYRAVSNYGALLIDRAAYKGLFIKGPCGIGKTVGLKIIASHFGYPVFTPQDFVSVWKDLNGHPAKFRQYVINSGDVLEHPHPMVIDEIGVMDRGRNYGEVTDIMSEVLDARYQAFVDFGQRTIAATNLNDQEIFARYGARISDRLNEFMWQKSVTGKSLRGIA